MVEHSASGRRQPGDEGAADPAVAEALAAYAAGAGGEHAALTALAASRLLVPVVAVLADAAAGADAIHEADGAAPTTDECDIARVITRAMSHSPDRARSYGTGPRRADGANRAGETGGVGGTGETGVTGETEVTDEASRTGETRGTDEASRTGGTAGEKVSEMALPTLVGRDGRLAVLAFTCLDSLTRWRPDARPVPVPADRVWQAGAQEASAVVIDVAGPVPLAVDGARLAALAGGGTVPLPHEDPDVRAAAEAALAGETLITGARLAGPGDGSDITLLVTLAPGCDPALAGAAVRRAAAGLMARTGGRFRRGVEVAVVETARTLSQS